MAHTATTSSRRAAVIVRANNSQQQPFVAINRREAAAAALAATSFLASPSPALAFLGFGGDGNERYAAETTKIIAEITDALALELGNPGREEALKSLRQSTVEWVSRYRRDPNFSGRPSYSNLYSAINAIDGQLTSFGSNSKFPAKRLERIQKEVSDADKQLQRGR